MATYVMIDNDMWDDCGKTYRVISQQRYTYSTGIKLHLECEDGTVVTRTEPSHTIEWIEK